MDRNLFSDIGIRACSYINGGMVSREAAIRAACIDLAPANHTFLVHEFMDEVKRRKALSMSHYHRAHTSA